MRALLSAAAVIAVALALTGCHDRQQQQPLPGPKSSAVSGLVPGGTPHAAPAATGTPQERGSPAEINWFQGTLEEAFSRRPSTEDRPQFRY